MDRNRKGSEENQPLLNESFEDENIERAPESPKPGPSGVQNQSLEKSFDIPDSSGEDDNDIAVHVRRGANIVSAIDDEDDDEEEDGNEDTDQKKIR